MATYKVPQNVEAEDKLLGPFSFKQFIYLMIASAGVFVAWLMLRINPWLVIVPLPFIGVFAILGIYHREDQPVETYLLAAINFFTKPRKRKWDPEGHVENVRITAPKKKQVVAQKHLERGQLERLAHIVDTRGWYIKRPELQEPMEEGFIQDDDRLINPSLQVTQEPLDVHMTDDMLSPTNPTLEDYDVLAEKSHTQARAEAIAKMHQAAEPTPAIETPTQIHYNPYPENITQHKLDPKSGKLAKEDSSPQTTELVPQNVQSMMASMDPNAKISDVAQVAKKEAEGSLTGELAKGQEISLRG